jgi:aryl-alcohol dehydrogenase-like predicted oxidoreductase
MESRTFGTSPLAVSAVGLGCNNFGRLKTVTEKQEAVTAVVDAALESGITFFDTADVYGRDLYFGASETMLGVALQGRREGVVIGSKFGHAQMSPVLVEGAAMGSRDHIRAAVEASLTRLQVETIDLYQLHTPDAETPIEETLAALDELVREGKVREIGHTNLTADELRSADDAAIAAGTARFVSASNEFSALAREVERDILPAALERGVGFIPFYPLANGLLTGKFQRDSRPDDARITVLRPQIADTAPWDRIEAFQAFADARGISMLEATFGWLLTEPALTTVIAGATRPEQVRQNAAAGDAWRPTTAERAEIDAIFPA